MLYMLESLQWKGISYYYNAKLICRLRYVEQELAKRQGRNFGDANQVENDVKRAEDELYKIPEHLKVSDAYCALSLTLTLFCETFNHY